MVNTNRLKHHADLVDRMAQAQGINLQDAVMRGGMTPDDVSDMVLTCTKCTQADACARWLSEVPVTVSDTPHSCRNADVFAKMAMD